MDETPRYRRGFSLDLASFERSDQRGDLHEVWPRPSND